MSLTDIVESLRVLGYNGDFDVDSLYQECRRRKIFSSLVRIPPGVPANKTQDERFTARSGVMFPTPEEALADLLLADLEGKLDKQVS